MKFYKCNICGNVATKLDDSGVPLVCCGEVMNTMVANTTDGAGEKHVPVVSIDKDIVTVKVGEVTHPMEDKHYIPFIVVETEKGFLTSFLKPGNEPMATFKTSDKVVRVYEYCNLHGLWKVDL
jgi:superoxide reductase